MGILDDAIREHLELRRRAGADAAEIARLERTAFGDEALPPAPAAQDQPVAAEPAAAQAEAPAPVVEPPAAVEPEPEPEPAPAQPAEPEPVDQPTRQFTLEELEDAEQHAEPPAPAPAAEEGEVDELEETPDFLQETPEHDRLWFEQKPPKDFDF
jgi:hypothetical protein